MSDGDVSRLQRALLSLEGLSIGDGFGERFFLPPATATSMIASRALPAPPWRWTDDTAMALSVVEVLQEHGAVNRDALAARFAARYRWDPCRGYGGTAHEILSAIGAGTPWAHAAKEKFGGHGSMGNGGAMRSAPVGAWFAGDLDRVVEEARASAEPTHAHPEGQAGAIAVALAAAFATESRGAAPPEASAFLRSVAERTPPGPTRDGILAAADLPFAAGPEEAARVLGNGSRVIACDTVPFALWCAAHRLDDYVAALWTTVAGLGDRDTTCAIVGGIVALAVGEGGIPDHFRAAREPLGNTPGLAGAPGG